MHNFDMYMETVSCLLSLIPENEKGKKQELLTTLAT